MEDKRYFDFLGILAFLAFLAFLAVLLWQRNTTQPTLTVADIQKAREVVRRLES